METFLSVFKKINKTKNGLLSIFLLHATYFCVVVLLNLLLCDNFTRNLRIYSWFLHCYSFICYRRGVWEYEGAQEVRWGDMDLGGKEKGEGTGSGGENIELEFIVQPK
jgi:hypothetical protein